MNLEQHGYGIRRGYYNRAGGGGGGGGAKSSGGVEQREVIGAKGKGCPVD